MIQVAAGLLEQGPLLGIARQDVAQHRIVQTLQFASDPACKLEPLDLGSGELGFHLLNTMPGGKKPVNRAASHQKQGGNQNPEANAKRSSHVYVSTRRPRAEDSAAGASFDGCASA